MVGRPRKKSDERRENILRIRLTRAERESIENSARHEQLDASTWARRVLLLESRRLRRE